MNNEAKAKTPPARWRKARFPSAGTRWDTPMNRGTWFREHGRDAELWQGAKRLAVVYPDGGWIADGARAVKGKAETVELAKAEAKAAVKAAALEAKP